MKGTLPLIGYVYRHCVRGRFVVLAIARDHACPKKRLVIYESLDTNDPSQTLYPQGTVWARDIDEWILKFSPDVQDLD